uniref:HTH cro/C1-type domain-containing protein n=1 Tax=Candidatus Kentrum sp. LFY TaxID=2126342 RepID=A0A450WD26_9GAMM|nr:MAG: hypothetical protein BECKLFY1418C_GA0070996_10125 [Candidatus Kentron sp. LFY]
MKGQQTPTLSQLEEIAEILEVPAEWLLFGDVTRLNEDERDVINAYRKGSNGMKEIMRTTAKEVLRQPASNDAFPTQNPLSRRDAKAK